jgi:hypothetical protein
MAISNAQITVEQVAQVDEVLLPQWTVVTVGGVELRHDGGVLCSSLPQCRRHRVSGDQVRQNERDQRDAYGEQNRDEDAADQIRSQRMALRGATASCTPGATQQVGFNRQSERLTACPT